MTDFFRPSTSPKARTQHRCSYCGEPIHQGEVYQRQTGMYDGRWFCNKFHPECADDLDASGGGEFLPYSNERPATLDQLTGRQPDSAPPPTATPPDRAGQ